jgi:sarcosine oxidase
MRLICDAAVIGIGTMGSFTVCELARRGLRVIGLDRFNPPHNRGSHSGDTRVFRTAYTEHPDYVPLALRAGALWDEYSEISGSHLITRSGMLSIGPAEGRLIRGILHSAAVHRLETIQYTPAEVQQRFPAFDVAEPNVGVYEPKAGWIDANAAIETALRLAEGFGANLQLDNPALRWVRARDHFEIFSATGTVLAERLVITAGAWTTQILAELGLPLRVERKVLTWINPIEPALFQPGVFPVFAYGDEFLYGFPAMGKEGVKLAVHGRSGRAVLDPGTPASEATSEDAGEPLAIGAKLLPRLAGPLPQALQRVKQMKTCLYVMSRDEHFFVDRHPEWQNLVFAAGFSGHGFKFAPAIGEILADLATVGTTTLPIGFLSANRMRIEESNASCDLD